MNLPQIPNHAQRRDDVNLATTVAVIIFVDDHIVASDINVSLAGTDAMNVLYNGDWYLRAWWEASALIFACTTPYIGEAGKPVESGASYTICQPLSFMLSRSNAHHYDNKKPRIQSV